jgi:hypothetical protein
MPATGMIQYQNDCERGNILIFDSGVLYTFLFWFDDIVNKGSAGIIQQKVIKQSIPYFSGIVE